MLFFPVLEVDLGIWNIFIVFLTVIFPYRQVKKPAYSCRMAGWRTWAKIQRTKLLLSQSFAFSKNPWAPGLTQTLLWWWVLAESEFGSARAKLCLDRVRFCSRDWNQGETYYTSSTYQKSGMLRGNRTPRASERGRLFQNRGSNLCIATCSRKRCTVPSLSNLRAAWTPSSRSTTPKRSGAVSREEDWAGSLSFDSVLKGSRESSNALRGSPSVPAEATTYQWPFKVFNLLQRDLCGLPWKYWVLKRRSWMGDFKV